MEHGIYDGGAVIASFVTPLTVKSNKPIFVSDTLSLKRKINQRSAQRWEIETKLMPMSRGSQDLFVYLTVKGHTGVMDLLIPQNYGADKSRTATASINASGTAGDTQVLLTDFAGLIPKGSFLRFANHSKMYMLAEDAEGVGTYDIFPGLSASMTTEAMSYANDVVMKAYYDTDNIVGMTYTDGILMDLGVLTFVEAL